MPLDLEALKNLGNLPGKTLDTVSDVVKTGAKSVKDWRDTNTERTRDGYHHEEKMYESKTSRVLGAVGAAINAIDKLSSSYAQVKESYNRRAEIGNVAENNRMKHEEEMEKIMIHVSEVRGKLAHLERETDLHMEERRAWLISSIKPLQEEHTRFMAQNDEAFLTEETQKWLGDIREAMLRIGELLLKFHGDEK